MSDHVYAPAGGLSHPRNRLSVTDIAKRLEIGKMSVYKMLKDGTIPAIRVGKRWLVTRYAYEQWERTCGLTPKGDK